VCGCVADLSLTCVALPSLLCAFFVINIVRARGSNLWRFLANGNDTLKEKDRGIQVDHWINLKGVECNPHPLGCHNMEVGKCYLVEPRDKNRVSLVFLLCDCFVHKNSFHSYLVTLTL
jgi:hypothetical protein